MAEVDERVSREVDLATLLRTVVPARARKHPAWTWADEVANVRTRMCLCCGRPGHYQETLTRHIAEHGMEGLGVYLDGPYIGDGHHRVIAAMELGIATIPVESRDEAEARWVRDHGYADWENRSFGDV